MISTPSTTINYLYVFLRTPDQQQELFAPDFESFLSASSAIPSLGVATENEQLKLWNTPTIRDYLRIQLKGTRGVRFEQSVGLLMDSCDLVRKLIVWHFVLKVSNEKEYNSEENIKDTRRVCPYDDNTPICFVLPYFNPSEKDNNNNGVINNGKFSMSCKIIRRDIPLTTADQETTGISPVIALFDLSTTEKVNALAKKPLSALFLLELFVLDDKPLEEKVDLATDGEKSPSTPKWLLDSDVVGMIFVYLRRLYNVSTGAKPPSFPALLLEYVTPPEESKYTNGTVTLGQSIDANIDTSNSLTYSQKCNVVVVITSLRIVSLYPLLAGLMGNVRDSSTVETLSISAVRSDIEETAKLIDKTLIISGELHRQKLRDNCDAGTCDSNKIMLNSVNGDKQVSHLTDRSVSDTKSKKQLGNDYYYYSRDDNDDVDGNFIMESHNDGLGGTGCFKCGRSSHKPEECPF